MARLRFRASMLMIALVAGTLAGPAAQERAAEPRQTFRSAVDLVSIQASVRDKRGRPLNGLTQRDFEVRDNGQLRPVLSLRADRRSPVSLAVLVDTSGSMRLASNIAMARQALGAILSQLRAGQDEAALFTFDAALHERRGFTRNPEELRDTLTAFEPFGTTSLYDATAETARRLAVRSATHKAVVVLTDGIDTSSKLSAPQVSGLASSIDVPVYIVATVTSVDRQAMTASTDGAPRARSADLRELAEWTGGQFMFASTLTETMTVATSLLDELRQQYVLAIEATGAREWRRLDVRVKRPAASVRARSGYFGG